MCYKHLKRRGARFLSSSATIRPLSSFFRYMVPTHHTHPEARLAHLPLRSRGSAQHLVHLHQPLATRHLVVYQRAEQLLALLIFLNLAYRVSERLQRGSQVFVFEPSHDRTELVGVFYLRRGVERQLLLASLRWHGALRDTP